MSQFFCLGDRLVRLVARLAWLPPLLARLTLAGVFIESGWGKLHNIPKVVVFFTSLGLFVPEFQAHLVAITEFGCGILLLIGLLTRLASFPLLITMTVAIATAKREDLHGLTDLFGFSEYLYIVLFVWLIVAGAGPISLDHLLLKQANRPSRS